MNVLIEQQPTETQKSFNPEASINMIRFDLSCHGEVMPQTLERIQDEELSYFIEGSDRAARTTFALKRDYENQLIYFDRGQWRPYISTLITGLEVAEQEAQGDSRKRFLAEWARENLSQGFQMQALQPGEQKVWYSPYPEKEENIYGSDFLQTCGLVPDRRLGFLYLACCEDDGTVVLETQTVDRSNQESFDAVAKAAAQNPQASMDELLLHYDQVLENTNGGEFYAGRRNAEVNENAWEIIKQQQDLIKYFIEGLQEIAESPLYGYELENAVKRHTYGSWAAFKTRIDRTINKPKDAINTSVRVYDYHELRAEVNAAFTDFAAKGIALVGCGGALKMLFGEQDMLDASPQDVFNGIFGNKTGEDKYGSLTFKCPKKGCLNTRKPGKLISNCQRCGADVRC